VAELVPAPGRSEATEELGGASPVSDAAATAGTATVPSSTCMLASSSSLSTPAGPFSGHGSMAAPLTAALDGALPRSADGSLEGGLSVGGLSVETQTSPTGQLLVPVTLGHSAHGAAPGSAAAGMEAADVRAIGPGAGAGPAGSPPSLGSLAADGGFAASLPVGTRATPGRVSSDSIDAPAPVCSNSMVPVACPVGPVGPPGPGSPRKVAHRQLPIGGGVAFLDSLTASTLQLGDETMDFVTGAQLAAHFAVRQCLCGREEGRGSGPQA
jgi:hypothetical protein